MSDKIVAFLPCRKGSERVKRKNTREFAGYKDGLVGIKLTQLIKCREINEILVSTDDPDVMDICSKVGRKSSKAIRIIQRPSHLARSETSTDELVHYVPTLIKSGSILWTHVTSPFVDELTYAKAIQRFREALSDSTHDSLMSVNRLQTFIWDQNNAVNYDRALEKWPHTQTLPVWYEINSAIFIAPIHVYIEEHDRIGKRPILFELPFPETIDIDWEEDFIISEKIWTVFKKQS